MRVKIEDDMGIHEEYNWNDVLAYIIPPNIITLFIILTFVTLGGVCKDYLDYSTKVNIFRTIVASFIIAFALYVYKDYFSNLNVVLLFGYIFGYASPTVNLVLTKVFSDENLIKKIFIRIINGFSGINLSDLTEDKKDKE